MQLTNTWIAEQHALCEPKHSNHQGVGQVHHVLDVLDAQSQARTKGAEGIEGQRKDKAAAQEDLLGGVGAWSSD